jgi:hypothetical protein
LAQTQKFQLLGGGKGGKHTEPQFLVFVFTSSPDLHPRKKTFFFTKTETNFYICFSFYVVQVFPVEGFLFQKQQQQQINGGTKRKWGGKKIPGVSVSFFI